jgi:hypothetical protein
VSKRPWLAVTTALTGLTVALLSLTLSGCGDHSDLSTQGNTTSPAASSSHTATPSTTASRSVTGIVTPQTAAKITDAVTEAQSELDALDQDFATDTASTK